MGKSTLLAFLDEPFKPHIVGVFQMSGYLWHYYQLKNPQNRSYITILDEANKELNGYNHPHNSVLSLIWLWCFWLCVYCDFLAFLLYSAYKGAKSTDSWVSFWGVALFLCVA